MPTVATLTPTQVERSVSRFYRPELDALRFFAFFGVFAFHVLRYPPEFFAKLHLPAFFAEDPEGWDVWSGPVLSLERLPDYGTAFAGKGLLRIAQCSALLSAPHSENLAPLFRLPRRRYDSSCQCRPSSDVEASGLLLLSLGKLGNDFGRMASSLGSTSTVDGFHRRTVLPCLATDCGSPFETRYC